MKGTYEKNSELLFIIQMICFMKRDKIDGFYKQLKKIYKENKYKSFFDYIILENGLVKNILKIYGIFMI